MDNMENMFTSVYYDKNNKQRKSINTENNSDFSEIKTHDNNLLNIITKNNTDANTNIDIYSSPSILQYKPIIDPLSVIIKLAIISNRPIGTKLFIKHNIIHIQEQGIFQGLCRYIYKTNRNDLQYLYNPIECACKHYLDKEYRKKVPQIKNLFICAQRGILQLIETYKETMIIKVCLNYYYTLIDNYVKEIYTPLFRKDDFTPLYNETLLFSLNNLWSFEKIKIVLDMISFLNDDVMANENVKSLDIFIQNIDKQTQKIIQDAK
jgi:hypothetical protein